MTLKLKAVSSPKRWCLPASPHGVTTQKINVDILISVRTQIWYILFLVLFVYHGKNSVSTQSRYEPRVCVCMYVCMYVCMCVCMYYAVLCVHRPSHHTALQFPPPPTPRVTWIRVSSLWGQFMTNIEFGPYRTFMQYHGRFSKEEL
jgi:hypothetical protein